MLRILGKASSIKVRKVLWTCAEFASLNPNAMVPVIVDGDLVLWESNTSILEAQLDRTGAYALGAQFTLADIVLGLSMNRWLMTPIERPAYPALAAYAGLLRQRPGCRAFGMNGVV